MTISPLAATWIVDGVNIAKSAWRLWCNQVETDISAAAAAAASAGAAAAAASGARPNLLINGDFQINQRGFAGGGVTPSAYAHDRWKANTNGAIYSVSGYTVSVTSGELVQVIEPGLWGYQNLASTTLTVSVEDPTADVNVNVGGAGGSITAGAGRRSVTLTTLAGATADLTLALSGAASYRRVKLEVGASATEWEARPGAVEFILCQRYYQKLSRTSEAAWMPGMAISSGIWRAEIYSPVKMRAAPTVTFSANNTFQLYTGAAQFAPTAAVGALSDALTGFLRFDTTAMTSGAIYELRSASGQTSTVQLSAEL